jgi:hypothetical protein
MTEEQEAELKMLGYASEKGKFALSVTAKLSKDEQEALERLQLREWIKLIDIAPLFTGEGFRLVRVFMLTAPALAWLKKTSS